MLADIIRIGNSKGIRLPAYVLKECNIKDAVNVEISEGKIILIPVDKPRQNWGKSFEMMHSSKDDELIMEDSIEDEEDWVW